MVMLPQTVMGTKETMKVPRRQQTTSPWPRRCWKAGYLDSHLQDRVNLSRLS